MHLILKKMMMRVLSTKMTVKMQVKIQMMMKIWTQPRRDLVVKHLELVNQKKLRERSWRINLMILQLMSMILKKLNLTKKMTRWTWMTLGETPRTKQLQTWGILNSNNNHKNYHNVIRMKRMLMTTKKYQEHIIPPNMQTYKYLKMSKIFLNISSDTNPKR